MNLWSPYAHMWQQFKPPLRPSASDLTAITACVQRRYAALKAAGNDSLRVLILGATPEYHALAWPPGTHLLAVDCSQAILDHVWPGPPGTSLCANWLELTPAIGRFDLVLGDGCLCQLAWPAQYAALVKVLYRLMKPGAELLTRAFLRGATHEDFAAAVAGLRADPQPELSKSKLRLRLAAQPDATTGISTGECWLRLAELGDDFTALAAMLGATEVQVDELAPQYLASDQRRYHYPTEAELVRLLSANDLFTLVERFEPSYTLGRHTPTLVLRTTAVADVV